MPRGEWVGFGDWRPCDTRERTTCSVWGQLAVSEDVSWPTGNIPTSWGCHTSFPCREFSAGLAASPELNHLQVMAFG